MLNGSPGFSEMSIGAAVSDPVPDKYTMVLLRGSFQLDDEIENTTETLVGLQIEGLKILTVRDNSIIVWFPSICCWDSSECALARKDEYRRNLGVVIPRDP